MAVKYALHPGYIISKTDGDRHFIPAHRLASLYGVRMSECVIATNESLRIGDRFTHLWPLYDGNYEKQD